MFVDNLVGNNQT